MGRKSKAKDRGYMTATEWRTEGGGFKEASKTDYKRLPFYCCAISFLPFEDAVRCLMPTPTVTVACCKPPLQAIRCSRHQMPSPFSSVPNTAARS